MRSSMEGGPRHQRVSCPDCFRRVSVDEDQEPAQAIDYHRLSGDCRARPKTVVSDPRPKDQRLRKFGVDAL